jgi:DNA-directed RNA polymerase specialized sigma24 family protein
MAFPTTRWTLLAEATLNGDPAGQAALTRMCEAYRRPIEEYLGCRGCKPQEIDDLVQDFFLRWLKSRAWKRADKDRGRFRNFVMGGVMHVLAKHHHRGQAQKRGGGMETDSLDAMKEAGLEPPGPEPEDIMEFDRRWAVSLVENSLAAVAEEEQKRGKAAEFAVLRYFLPGAEEMISLEEAVIRLGTSLNAVKVAVYRLRVRFRERLRAEVAQTVSAPHEIEEELLYLRTLLLSQPKTSTSAEQKGNTP